MKTAEQILKECKIRPNKYGFIKQPVNKDEIFQAMRLYSDQQNKELREQWKQAVEFAATKGAENNRLTKEVEELKERHSAQVGRAFEKTQELTRLLELLERAGSMMSTVKHLEVLEVIDKVKYDQLLTEIDQTLKPMYNTPYIEGKTDLQNEG